MMSIKNIAIISTLFLIGCNISGNYNYTKQGISERHMNEIVLTYNGKINNINYKVYNKINHDPSHLDKPPFYETSYEIWFW